MILGKVHVENEGCLQTLPPAGLCMSIERLHGRRGVSLPYKDLCDFARLPSAFNCGFEPQSSDLHFQFNNSINKPEKIDTKTTRG